jgi:hypothetical protein
MREKRSIYRLLVEKPDRKRPLGRPRHRWVDNAKMDVGEIGWRDIYWISLGQNTDKWRTLVNAVVMNLQVL